MAHITLRITNIPSFIGQDKFCEEFLALEGCEAVRLSTESGEPVGFLRLVDEASANLAFRTYQGWTGWGQRGLNVELVPPEEKGVKRARDSYDPQSEGNGVKQTRLGGAPRMVQGQKMQPTTLLHTVVNLNHAANQGSMLNQSGSGIPGLQHVGNGNVQRPQQPANVLTGGGGMAVQASRDRPGLKPDESNLLSPALLGMGVQNQNIVLPERQPGMPMDQPGQQGANANVITRPLPLNLLPSPKPGLTNNSNTVLQGIQLRQLQAGVGTSTGFQSNAGLSTPGTNPGLPGVGIGNLNASMVQNPGVNLLNVPGVGGVRSTPIANQAAGIVHNNVLLLQQQQQQQQHQHQRLQPQQQAPPQQQQAPPPQLPPQNLMLAPQTKDQGGATVGGIVQATTTGIVAQPDVLNFRGLTNGGNLGVVAAPPLEIPPDAASTLYIDGLPEEMTKRELAHIFRGFEGYQRTRIVVKDGVKREGKVTMGFVDFTSPECATIALNQQQGYPVDLEEKTTAALKISYARPLKYPKVAMRGIGGGKSDRPPRGSSDHSRSSRRSGKDYNR